VVDDPGRLAGIDNSWVLVDEGPQADSYRKAVKNVMNIRRNFTF
jgi:hypothetical protein